MTAALAIVLGGVDITTKVDMTTVSMQLAGSQETAMCEFDLIDKTNTVAATDEETLTVTEVGTAEVLFGGFVRSRRITVINTGRLIHLTAVDYNSLLDRSIVVSDSRTAGESDLDRLTYLMTTYGTQFSSDYSLIATLNSALPAQKFVAITLRQAIERVLGQASSKSSYYVDPTGRLVTYDRSVVTAAPFNVRVGTPGGGELAPEDFAVDNDASNLANAIYVVGATAAGSGWFTDATSISTYGRRERFFNAPDADTHAKAMQVGLAVLEDQKNPIPRGSFTTRSPSDGWRIGQSTVVTSTQHGLAGVTYRIARVTVRYLTGAGRREYAIELGAPLPTLSALLSSAHGGGGGYPWTSPGGAANFPPFPSIGGTSGGGAIGDGCGGCPPFLFGEGGPIGHFYDYFGRTSTPTDHWGDGTAGADLSTSGHEYGPAGFYVNGFGALWGTVAATPGAVTAETQDVAEFTAAQFRIEADFTFRPYRSEDYPGDPYYLLPDDLAYPSIAGGLGFRLTEDGGTDYIAGSTPGGLTANTVYTVKWTVDRTRNTSRVQCGTSDITTVITGSGTGDPGVIDRVLQIRNGGGNGTIVHVLRIESFDLGAATPSPGQQVNNEAVGTGDGSTVTFTTDYPWRPGGIVVRINGIDVTDSVATFVPTTGSITFTTAPKSGSEITVSYVAAP